MKPCLDDQCTVVDNLKLTNGIVMVQLTFA